MVNIPKDFVEVEILVDENGKLECSIVGHGPNTSCTLEKDDEVLKDLIGNFTDIEDYDYTDEYYGTLKPIEQVSVSGDPVSSKQETNENDGIKI